MKQEKGELPPHIIAAASKAPCSHERYPESFLNTGVRCHKLQHCNTLPVLMDEGDAVHDLRPEEFRKLPISSNLLAGLNLTGYCNPIRGNTAAIMLISSSTLDTPPFLPSAGSKACFVLYSRRASVECNYPKKFKE